MVENSSSRGVIPADRVQRVQQPVIVECGDADHPEGGMTVIPILDGDRLAGIEVRCNCGQSVLVECVYGEEA